MKVHRVGRAGHTNDAAAAAPPARAGHCATALLTQKASIDIARACVNVSPASVAAPPVSARTRACETAAPCVGRLIEAPCLAPSARTDRLALTACPGCRRRRWQRRRLPAPWAWAASDSSLMLVDDTEAATTLRAIQSPAAPPAALLTAPCQRRRAAALVTGDFATTVRAWTL